MLPSRLDPFGSHGDKSEDKFLQSEVLLNPG